MSIMVLGSINMDLTTYVPKLPRPGETLFGTSYITVPGGKGNNQGVAAARMGAEVVFVGRVGADSFGDEVIEKIRSEKVDTSLISRDSERGTGLAVINVDENAQNAIIVISGANMAIDSKDVERAEKALDGIDILMLQLEVPLDASYALAKIAKERGVKVLLDPAPAPKPPLADEVYRVVDIITPNETETEALVGFKPQNVEEAAKAAKMLREKGVETAIIKLGAKGVYFESENLHEHIPISWFHRKRS